MKKLIYIIVVALFSTTFIYGQNVWTMTPYERVQYFDETTWDSYNEQSHSWKHYASSGYHMAHKYFLDLDGDGYGDPNNYIILLEWGGYHIYNNINSDTVSTNNTTLNIYDASGNSHEVNVTTKSYFFDSKSWVRKIHKILLFDCDDTNTNLPSGLQIYYKDTDGDSYGNNEDWAKIAYTTGCNEDISHLALNSNDCNDYSAYVGDQPALWYLDSDGDGYGDSAQYISSCQTPGNGYTTIVDGDCDDTNSEYNIEQITWYADFDDDGFGDANDSIIASCPPENYIRDCYFDDCPTETGTNNGCPLVAYEFENDTKNYVYERYYLNEFTEETITNATQDDVLESISYTDGLGRTKQQVAVKSSPLGKDVVQHYEYDGNGITTKGYLPYTSTSNMGLYDTNALANTLSFYNTPEFDNTTNPFVENVVEASPLRRVLEQGFPGEDWQVDTTSDYDHTMKYNYTTNTTSVIKKFSVSHDSNIIENTELVYDGTYSPNELVKVVVKNENWQPNQTHLDDNTTVTYTDKYGRKILSRTFNENEPHDTYYIYDNLGNLTYVLPPEASDEILDIGAQGFRVASQTNYSWVDMVNLDKKFAEDYNKKLSDYENQNILNADIENEYGGQGGFTVTTLNNSEEITLSISFSSTQELELRRGSLLSLKPYGDFKDTEIGRIEGANYSYVFYIKNNAIHIDGKGKVLSINHAFNSSSKLTYNKNYLWTRYTEVDHKFANAYEKDVLNLAKQNNQNPLHIDIDNDYGGLGGLNVTIDANDNIALTFNSNTDIPLKLKEGVILTLDTKRRLQNRTLGTITGTNFNYEFSLVDNTILVKGGGSVTAFNGYLFNSTPTEPNEIEPETVQGLSYIYHYDYRNRLIERKIPGKEWEHIVYDKLDRVAMTQDAKMRLNNQWQFTKYDITGRMAYSGLFEYTPTGTLDDSARSELQSIMNNQTQVHEVKTANPQTISTTSLYYANATYPNNTADMQITAINYYDDYSALDTNHTGLIKTENDEVYGESISMATNNLPTVSKVRVLGTDKWTTSVVYYNEDTQPIYTASKNDYLDTVDYVKTDIDFSGKVKETASSHIKRFLNCSTTNPLMCTDYFKEVHTVNYFTYDKQGRLLTNSQTINGSQPELIVNNHYDELGRLENKNVGGAVASTPEDSQGLQKVDFTYNIRGWLKGVNEDLEVEDVFGFKLNYNTVNQDNATPLYNGNISEMYWETKNFDNTTTTEAYDYKYDALNRIKKANYHLLSGNSDEDYNLDNVSYDKNGNITVLTRKGIISETTAAPYTDIIDALTYDYAPKSNRLLKVTDAATPLGFKDNSTTAETEDEDDYLYDINGSMTKDANKGITDIQYNHLNLPTEITVNNATTNGTITYVYDALGTKLKKIVNDVDNNTTKTTLYANGFIYEGDNLKLFPQAEGYVEPNTTNAGYSYVYQFRDHLGNVRLTYKDADNNNEITANANEIILVRAYYPFGLEHQGSGNFTSANSNSTANKFKFNGTEYEESLGVNLYEMPFRQYDPTIARWTSIDPVTHFSMSTYTAFDNNPVYWADPSGADAEGDYYGMYDLEWGGYMMSPDDPGFSDEGQNYGYGDFFGNFLGFGGSNTLLDEIVIKSTPKNNENEIPVIELEEVAVVEGEDLNEIIESSEAIKQKYNYKQVSEIKQNVTKNNFSDLDMVKFSSLSRNIMIMGTVWGSVDINYSTGTYLTTKGIRKPLFKPNGAFRSSRAATFGLQSKLIGTVSKGLAGAGLIIDGVGVYNYYYSSNPDDFIVHPAKAGVNTFMTGVGLYGGIPGWITSGLYFTLDLHMSYYENRLMSDQIFLEKEFKKATEPLLIGPKM